jgi:hypothetical protein
MDSIYSRIRKSPRHAAVEARKNMKEQAADAYEFENGFDGDSKKEEGQSSWSRSLDKTTVTLNKAKVEIVVPKFYELRSKVAAKGR